jgi:alanyl-tRNA synthetase
LTDEELAALGKAVNRVIDADLAVSESYLSVDEARKAYNLTRLPDDAGERIRIVSIGDYDHCPCIGPHVDATGEIGAFRITSASHDDGVLRIRFKLKRP